MYNNNTVNSNTKYMSTTLCSLHWKLDISIHVLIVLRGYEINHCSIRTLEEIRDAQIQREIADLGNDIAAVL